MSASRFSFLVAVHAFFLRNGKVLLLRRQHTGYMDGYWSVPAGHVDGSEKILAAMRREIREETGLTEVSATSKELVMHRVCSPTEERIDYFFVFTEWQGKARVTEPDKSDALKFFPLDNLPEKTVPYIRFALEALQDNQEFLEFIEPSYDFNFPEELS